MHRPRSDEVKILNRRESERFPLVCAVRYRGLGRRGLKLDGNGITIDISSSGVLFTSSDEVPVGSNLELFIDWPLSLNSQCLLSLVVTGPIIRHAAKGQSALKIKTYEFRTRACVNGRM